MASEDLPWYVLYTKPRNEKKVALQLTKAGYTVYCPLQKVRRQWSDRTKVIKEPLFKSYLFIQIEDHRRDEVFYFPGALRYLFWQHRPAIVREEEIKTIQKWLGHYSHEYLQIEELASGSCVRITSGQFMNKEGILLDQKRNRALVQIKDLGLQLSLDLQNNELLKIL
jgi:transcription antitermination factor NusG